MSTLSKSKLDTLTRTCSSLLKDPSYRFGPGGQPVIVGGDVWHIGSMDFKHFKIGSSHRSPDYISYGISASGITVNTTVLERSPHGLWVDPRARTAMTGEDTLEWLIHVVVSATQALPYFGYIAELRYWTRDQKADAR